MIYIVKENLKKFIVLTEKMTTYFYQQNKNSGYELYDEVLTSLANIMDELSYLNDQKILEVDIVKINSMLEKALQALMNQDTIMFADVMNFEIINEMRYYYGSL